MISWAVLRSVFDRVTVAAGFLAAVSGIVLAFFKPWLGIHYLWWLLFQVV